MGLFSFRSREHDLTDANGNLTGDGTYTYEWDALNRLRRVKEGETTIATYVYDALNRRVGKDVDGTVTSYAYDGWRAIEEYDDSSGSASYPDRQFVFGVYLDEPLTMDVNNDDDSVCYINGGTLDGADDRYYYHQNWQYSTVALSDPGGDLVEAYYYMPYGSHYRVTDDDGGGDPVQLDDYEQVDFMAASAIGNPYLFTGQRFDAETGMHYYKRRYYSSERARFISRDPLETSVSSYQTPRHELASSVRFTDYTHLVLDGRMSESTTDSSYGTSSVPAQYADGPHLYQYVRSNPILYVDPFGLVAGITAKRAKHLEYVGSIPINTGHEWIEYPGGSKGFWPNRGYVVLDPDPAPSNGVKADKQWDTKMRKRGKLKWGSGAGLPCDCLKQSRHMGMVVECVKAAPNPGWRSFPIRNNCRKYVKWAFEGCCISKG